jgi:hypothetical protein
MKGETQDGSEYARTDSAKGAGEEDRRHQKEIERVIAKHWSQERPQGESCCHEAKGCPVDDGIPPHNRRQFRPLAGAVGGRIGAPVNH